MNSDIADSTEPEDEPIVPNEAIDRATRRIVASYLPESEAERLRMALRGIVNTAEAWRQIGDLRPHVQPFRDFGTAVLPELIEQLPQLHRFRDWLPTNWRDKPGLSLDAALQVINEGIPLIWVPRAVIVNDLLYARTIEGRLSLLANRMREISRDCLAVLTEITDPEIEKLVPMASAAARALEDGDPSPAQALAGNVLDTWMRDAVGRGVFRVTGRRNLYAQVADDIEAVSDDTTLERFREVCVLRIGAELARRRCTLRLDRCLMHVISGGVLAKTLPSPVLVGGRAKLRGARIAAAALPAPATGPVSVRRKVSRDGVIMVTRQRLRVGASHVGRMVTLHVEDTHFRVTCDSTEISLHSRAEQRPVTRWKAKIHAPKAEPASSIS